MCGHGSITFMGDADEAVLKKLDAATSALAKALEHRGRHATGLMQISQTGEMHVQKAPVSATEFNKGRALVLANTRALAVHTRWATKGEPEWNKNNHPVAGPNGVLVMHNGVVADSWVRRSKGDPEVDTYAIAKILGDMRKRSSREGVVSFAKRAVREAGKIEGSMTLQLAWRGEPLLVSCKIESNPLHFAEVDGVRVTASTAEAVKKTIEALGLVVPTQPHSWTTKSQGSKRKPPRDVVHTGWRDEIYAAMGGEILIWNAGEHFHEVIDVPQPTLKKWASQSYASGSYAAGAQGKAATPAVNPTSQATRASGATTTPTASSPSTGSVSGSAGSSSSPAIKGFIPGDRVKTMSGSFGFVTDPAYTAQGIAWVPVYMFAKKLASGQEISGYNAEFRSSNLTVTFRPTPLAAQSMVRSHPGSTPFQPMGVQSTIDAEADIPVGDDFEAIVDAMIRAPIADDTCEVCGEFDERCETVEDVQLCQSCQAIAWENA